MEEMASKIFKVSQSVAERILKGKLNNSLIFSIIKKISYKRD